MKLILIFLCFLSLYGCGDVAKSAHIYRVNDSELQFIFNSVSDRLDKLESVRGAPTFDGPVINSATGVGQPLVRRKLRNSDVLLDVISGRDEELFFSIGANQEWVVTFQLDFGDLIGTTGIKLNVSSPPNSVVNYTVTAIDDTGDSISGASDVSGTDISLTITALNGDDAVVAVAAWINSGANGGQVALNWAQNSSSANPLTLKKGSFLVGHRVR